MRLHDYIRLLRLSTVPPPTLGGLRQLHFAHRDRFLFENLTIQTGGTVSVELPDIERKFLDEKRGGYCFEHNTLFAGALRDVGFHVSAYLGRVRRGPPERWKRTHMVLRVVVGSGGAGQSFLADVGFGAQSLIEPMPLADGATARQGGLTYSLRRDGHLWVLSMRDSTGTTDLYEFAEDPQTIGDIAIANFFTSAHPESVFRKTLTLQRFLPPDDRLLLRMGMQGTLTRWTSGKMTEEPFERSDLATIACEVFGVDLPAGPFVFEQLESRAASS